MSRVLILRPSAKINLTLRVGPIRPDGFHDVRTLMQSIALCDRLALSARRGPFVLAASSPGVPADRTNLVCGGRRAALARDSAEAVSRATCTCGSTRRFRWRRDSAAAARTPPRRSSA